MLLIGQSLELHRPALAAAVAVRDPAPLRERAAAQRAAGAQAIDVNAGQDGAALDLAWAAAALRPALPGVPLFLDAGGPAALALALDLCERDGVRGPLVANALPTDEVRESGGAALLRAVARAEAGLVIAPRGLARARPAETDAVAEAARAALALARAAGVAGPCYLDALAYPPALDAHRARRSLALLRAWRANPNATPLTAVGNVGHGAPAELRPALRLAYAAAAAGAGAGALILPVEQPELVAALTIAAGAREPVDAPGRWLRAVAQATAAGTRVPPAPATLPTLAAAARLLFG